MYKCVNNLNPQYLNKLFVKNEHPYEMRDSSKLIQSKFCTYTYGYKSFTYYGSKLWNGLPPAIKGSENIHVFKRKITEWCRSDKCDNFIVC